VPEEDKHTNEAMMNAWPCRRFLRPGDSAYLAPMVPFRFCVPQVENSQNQSHSTLAPKPSESLATQKTNPNGTDAFPGRRLYVVRIPGTLTTETLAEFSTFSRKGRGRVGKESLRWYN